MQLIKKIYEKIGPYPDFIHVDIIDNTMNEKAADTKLSKLEVVKAYWPNHSIETHIMSKNPIVLLKQNILNFELIFGIIEVIHDHQKALLIIQ